MTAPQAILDLAQQLVEARQNNEPEDPAIYKQIERIAHERQVTIDLEVGE